MLGGGAPLGTAEISRVRRRFHTGSDGDGDGFGLGLSIAIQSIEAIGGTLTIHNEAGEGVIARIAVQSGGVAVS